MCSRYLITREALKALAAQLGARIALETSTRYNLPPGGPVPAIRTQEGPEPARELVALHWGLVPRWARDRKSPPVNARAESLIEKPTFREAFKSRRCLLPANGFYEWKTVQGRKYPWLFQRSDEQPFGLAALWESWRGPDGETLESCAVITTHANSLMAPIHDRMPVMLTEETYGLWLDPTNSDPQKLAPVLAPFPTERMIATPLSTRVNSVANDDPECLSPASGDPAAEDAQLGLGF